MYSLLDFRIISFAKLSIIVVVDVPGVKCFRTKMFSSSWNLGNIESWEYRTSGTLNLENYSDIPGNIELRELQRLY